MNNKLKNTCERTTEREDNLKLGIIDKKYYANGVRTYEFLDSNVAPDGTIENTSGGT